jgi:hypothetical protein
MKRSNAEIIREYGPFAGVDNVGGVTYDGEHVWFAAGDTLAAFDPASGEASRSIDVAAHAGTAFDGQHLFQIAETASRRSTRRPAACSPPSRRRALAATPDSRGPRARSGSDNIATARSIRSIPTQGRFFAPSRATVLSPASPGSTANSGTAPGKATKAMCDTSTPHRRSARKPQMPAGVGVSGLESDGGDRFFCGGGRSGKVTAIRRPKTRISSG